MADELIIKDFSNQPDSDDYKVVQKGNIIESINKLKQVFHYIDLSYLKSGIFYHAWVGFRTLNQFKNVQDGHVFDFFKQHKCKNAVVDSSGMSGGFNEANDWLASYYMPKLINTGLRNVAVVLPKNIFAQLAVEDWDKKVGGFTTRNFSSLNDAVIWLKSV